MTKDRPGRLRARGHTAIVAPEDTRSGNRITRIIGEIADRDSGLTIRSHLGSGHGGQDTTRAGKGYSNCIDHVDHACDPSARRKRLENIITGARGGNSNDFGSLIRLASRSARPEIREEAWRSLLEHFSDKEGLLLFIALNAESAEIRHGAIDHMPDKDSQAQYFLDLTMNGSRHPDTRWHAFCTSMKVRFGEEFGKAMAEAIGLGERVKRNEATYKLFQNHRDDLLEAVSNESHFEDTRQYAKELAKIAAKGPAKTA